MERLRRALSTGSGLMAAIRDLQLQTDSAEAKLRAIEPINTDSTKEVLGAQVINHIQIHLTLIFI